jgi:hypothetical protein
MADVPVVIVGGGVAGLTCARVLQQAGRSFVIAEASDRIGGRVRSDQCEGFILDRGFQVLLTAYPEVRRFIDLRDLGLKPFFPGAMIWTGERFYRLADPFRKPLTAFLSLFDSVATIADKFRVLRLRRESMTGSLSDLWQRPERPTREYLEQLGFSERFIREFFQPFLSGVFLERNLSTSSRMLQFVIRMFGAGLTMVPTRGIERIPERLAAPLRSDCIRLNSPVRSLHADGVEFTSGERLSSPDIVVAAAGEFGDSSRREWSGTTCCYFDAPVPPMKGPYLILNGSGQGRVSNVTVLSEVAAEYAPAGRSLVSVSVPELSTRGDAEESEACRSELKSWFGSSVAEWRTLRVYRIPHALPRTERIPDLINGAAVTRRNGIIHCGDHLTYGSLNGAMASGRLAAETILSGS